MTDVPGSYGTVGSTRALGRAWSPVPALSCMPHAARRGEGLELRAFSPIKSRSALPHE